MHLHDGTSTATALALLREGLRVTPAHGHQNGSHEAELSQGIELLAAGWRLLDPDSAETRWRA